MRLPSAEHGSPLSEELRGPEQGSVPVPDLEYAPLSP